MVENVEIVEIEDPGVQQLLNKTADELHKKYNKQRKIKERFLNKKSPAKKVASIIIEVFFILFFAAAFIVCFSTINTTLNGYMPNIAGYTNVVISSKSMVKSGYNVGDIVVIHSVKPETLKVDDKIAFYVYAKSYAFEDATKFTKINSTNTKTKYSLTLPLLFGFQTKEIEQAAKAESDVVFHHIKEIYVDENGERWFQTYGSSNGVDPVDDWWINENYIVGIEDNSIISKGFLGVINLTSKPYGILFIAIPGIILVVYIALNFLKNIQIAKLELDCVEEKRKITDEICVRNNVGYQMDIKTKFKILAQATDENREEYIKLLWKDGKVPASVKKYYMRKKLLLSTNKQLLQLNRDCEKMFKQGKKPTKIAQYYLKEKIKIENRAEEIENRLKTIQKHKKELQKNS